MGNQVEIEMNESERLDISSFLERKFRERVAKAALSGEPTYTMVQFAKDIGVDYDALNAIYNRREGTERMQLGLFRRLLKYFKREFAETFDMTYDED